MDKRPQRMLIFTGEGKGKTTAALGMVMRALGHGQRVLVVQFVKSREDVGEFIAARKLFGVECVQFGLGFIPRKEGRELDRHRAEALRGLEYAAQGLVSGSYDMVVLDEVCVAIARGLLRESGVETILRLTHAGTCVVLTGRGAPHGLMELADTVTEMQCFKHGLHEGITAQAGVEY